MIGDLVKYEVWFSEDDDQAQVDVVVTAHEYGGTMRMIDQRTFPTYAVWEDIAAWIWCKITLDTKRTRV